MIDVIGFEEQEKENEWNDPHKSATAAVNNNNTGKWLSVDKLTDIYSKIIIQIGDRHSLNIVANMQWSVNNLKTVKLTSNARAS